MKLSLKPTHLKRYKDIGLLLLKYGSSDFANEFELEEAFDDLSPSVPVRSPAPEALADDLEKMGPTFIKLGQLLSSRADLLPERYLKPLERLQDRVKSFSYDEVEHILETELGARISKAFSYFNPEPMAAASLGQVHEAILRDGRPVVVKVQRPHIRRQIAEDFETLEELAAFFDEHTKIGRRYQFVKILEEFKTTLLHELDYEREAANLNAIAQNLKDFTHIVVPRPVHDYTTRSVLTMDYIRGHKITELSPLTWLDLNGQVLTEQLFKAYLKQVLVDGLFHADPHPGNIFLSDDGRIALLDLGMVGRTTPGMQENLLKLLLAMGDGRAEDALEIVLRISETRDDFNESDFRRRIGQLVAEQQDNTLQQIDVGKALLAVTKTSAETGLYVPSDLTVLGKTLLQLDHIGKTLAPDFNPNASIRHHVIEILRQRMLKSTSFTAVLSSLLDIKDFVGGLPVRLNKILDAAANAELELKIKAPDAQQLMTGFQKIANRIATGVILAALIVGAALLMQVQTSFQIFGYPGLAILCFIAAASGGAWLVLSILIKDHKDKKKRRP
jgi:predicted unusual protein kinase regulating ubiquinone biosynthesis (AarF/ABC1/UbiB family)